MSDEPKSRPRPKTSLSAAIGIGVGLAFALANLPNWRVASGWVVFGLIFGLTTGIVQARRSGSLNSGVNPSPK
jgi:hypothetical protein